MNGKSRTVVAVGIASFLHLMGFFLFLRFFEPIVPKSSENAIFIPFFEDSVPLMRNSIHRKQVSFVPPSPTYRQSGMPATFLQHPVTLPATIREPHVVSIADELEAPWNQSLTDSPGEGVGIESTINRELATSKLRATHAQKPFSSINRPHEQSVVTLDRALNGYARPHMLGNHLTEDVVLDTNLEVPFNKTDPNKIDVIFIISCRGEMRNYFEYAIAVLQREIQKYKDAGKDCRAGIIKSRFVRFNRPVHQIEYWPPSSDLERIVEIAQETRKLKNYSRDIFLNAIRYTLDRCTFRPEALRKIIAIGNDVPMCGGYSPLSIIELCSQKRVVLDIHGADDQIGPLLARETGGKWFSALENLRDRELLESIHISSQEWKVQFTIDSVVEGKFTDWKQEE